MWEMLVKTMKHVTKRRSVEMFNPTAEVPVSSRPSVSVQQQTYPVCVGLEPLNRIELRFTRMRHLPKGH